MDVDRYWMLGLLSLEVREYSCQTGDITVWIVVLLGVGSQVFIDLTLIHLIELFFFIW